MRPASFWSMPDPELTTDFQNRLLADRARSRATDEALAKGIDVAVVSKALGHANLATTVGIYSHWCRPMQERTTAVMETILAS